MNASAKRTIRLGLTVGLSLGAIVGIVGCADQTDGLNPDEQAALQSENGFNFNGFAFNGFSFNGFSFNGIQLQRHELQRHGVQRHELQRRCLYNGNDVL